MARGIIPTPDVALIDPQTGLVAKDWYDWFRSLQGITSGNYPFPATQVQSANPNVLDDYEEGTWTPTFAALSGAVIVSYGFQFGRYTKIGRTVMVHFNVGTTSWNHGTGSGQFLITGLPFPATEDFVGTFIYSNIVRAGFFQFAPVTASSASVLAVECSNNTGGLASLQLTHVPSGANFVMRGSVVYETDS